MTAASKLGELAVNRKLVASGLLLLAATQSTSASFTLYAGSGLKADSDRLS